MQLPYTRRYVEAVGREKLVPWPALWGGGLESIQASGLRLVEAVGLAPGSFEITDWDLSVAVDEWLMTTDKADLSALQRSVLAIAGMELFVREPGNSRTAPGVISLIESMVPALEKLPRDAAITVRDAVDAMFASREAIRLDEAEAALLNVLRLVVAGADGSDPRSLAEQAAAHVAVFNGEDYRSDRNRAFQLFRRMAECASVPPELAAALQVGTQRHR